MFRIKFSRSFYNTWWLDSVATTHVSTTLQGLTTNPNYESKLKKFLFMGNRMKAKIEGIGTYV